MTPLDENKIRELNTYIIRQDWLTSYNLLRWLVHDASFSEACNIKFSRWLNKPCTRALRDLASPYGNYWQSLAHQNAVDGIDAASLRIQ